MTQVKESSSKPKLNILRVLFAMINFVTLWIVAILAINGIASIQNVSPKLYSDLGWSLWNLFFALFPIYIIVLSIYISGTIPLLLNYISDKRLRS